MLSLRDLDVGYGDLLAVEGAALEVDAGQIVTLLGSNGAGKTTLIRTISGLLKPRRGVVEFEGEALNCFGPHQIVERGVIQVPEGRLLFPEMTVGDNLRLGAYSSRARGALAATLAEVLELFPFLKDRQDQLAGTLSGGEQQMVAIGRGLMARPKLLMLDEPSLGLAPIVVEEIFRVIQAIRERGTSILLVEQNVFQALRVADIAFVIENGNIAYSGAADAMLDDPRIRESYLGL
ncbi:MAG: ABC transporter ATP-binding protein [Deltaproteobacteria bacterium]|nr:ABC transporter ATP-binding protein [Deltaproteobacteria bacterium]